MKKTILLFIAFLIGGISYAQTNNGFNYKAIVTDNGNPVANASITVKVTFKQSGTLKWSETHSNVQTDANGIFSINLGEGTREDGAATFADVWWGSESMTLTVEVDAGNGFQTLVEDELLKPVPYAKSASKVYNDYFYNKTSDGSLRFMTPNVLGGYYIKKGTDGIEMGSSAIILGTADTPYFKVTSDNVWVKGELNATDSGDADMKAYVYGSIYSDGTIQTDASSDGFTASKVNTGEYKINFTNTVDYPYVVLVSTVNYARLYSVTRIDDSFNINIFDTSGSPADTGFMFVVYKK